MSEQTITSSPVNSPDVLMNKPLSRQVDVTVETSILEPVSHSFNSFTGGFTTFNLPAKAVLDAPNCALMFSLRQQANQAGNLVAYNYAVGGAGCIRRMSVRVGGNLMSTLDFVGEYMNIKKNYMRQEIKEGILDNRLLSSNGLENRIANGNIAAGAANLAFHQLYNPECDQPSSFGKTNTAGAVLHQTQIAKCIASAAGQTPEIIIKLSDVFEIFKENKLPLLAMAQTQIEIEWAPAGDPNAGNGTAIRECPLIDALIPASANVGVGAPARLQNCAVFMNTPTLLCDYIHYDETERQKIFNAINSPGGMALHFSEVMHTRGTNPQSTLADGGGTGTERIESQHILGLSQKEIKKMYCVKRYDQRTPRGVAELNAEGGVGIKQHLNILYNQFNSQDIIGETYNFFINNERVYDKDVSNKSLAHDYASQCHNHYAVPSIYYGTNNYNANSTRILFDQDMVSGAYVANANVTGRSKKYLAGSQSIIGLNLDKYNDMGSVPGNGVRIGSAPISFNYSRLATQNAVAGQGNTAALNLDFFLVYRRSLVIRPLGVDVSDS